ncbi:hypothetical protein ACQEVB_02720 [Pseudonocardia sp. CA-107938]|uniref:hypothetical protein n=1 Tax=Pseudonocardia sp. CA-107938 TaxID=3240021 RepID=UPI003D940CA0
MGIAILMIIAAAAVGGLVVFRALARSADAAPRHGSTHHGSLWLGAATSSGSADWGGGWGGSGGDGGGSCGGGGGGGSC